MIPYDDIGMLFDSSGVVGGLQGLIHAHESENDHHGVFRALLLKRRFELGLPLINPGELKGSPPDLKKEYEEYVEKICREIGQKYLDAGNIVQAFRYFRTLGELGAIREGLEKIDAKDASEEIIAIAIEQGVHPRRGFEMTLQAHGLCRGITVFDSEFSTSLDDKRYAAGLLVRALYKDLVLGVSRAILERFGQLPPETDLVELIRLRPWLFDDNRTHADPEHVNSVARIGLLCESPEELIMCLSIAEYGRMIGRHYNPAPHAPFEAGFADYARYARALLGQNVEDAATHFRSKLAVYGGSSGSRTPAEMVVLLLWRVGKKEEALDVWQQYLNDEPPEIPGVFIPSFYDLCIAAKSFQRLAETARQQGDSSGWAAARALETQNRDAPAAAPAPAATPASAASGNESPS